MLVPALLCCYLIAMPLQRFFDYLYGIMLAGFRNHTVLNDGKKI
jgi:hypothetical protein